MVAVVPQFQSDLSFLMSVLVVSVCSDAVLSCTEHRVLQFLLSCLYSLFTVRCIFPRVCHACSNARSASLET
jgi:hypothetical protein